MIINIYYRIHNTGTSTLNYSSSITPTNQPLQLQQQPTNYNTNNNQQKQDVYSPALSQQADLIKTYQPQERTQPQIVNTEYNKKRPISEIDSAGTIQSPNKYVYSYYT